MNQIAVALSVILSFAGWEFLGLASGGLISAGYLALFVTSPFRIVSTIVLSLLVYAIMLLLDRLIIVYGKRRFMLCVLLSFVLTWVWGLIIPSVYLPFDIRSIGFIIPGLIANDMLKQGVLKTIGVLVIITLLVELILLLIAGMVV